MKQSHAVYRQMTGYSLAGSVLLAVLGFWLILFTFPNVFYQLAAAGLPFGMAPIIDAALAFVGRLIDGSRTGFIDFLRVPLAAALPLMIWLLIAATGIRAIRTRSRRASCHGGYQSWPWDRGLPSSCVDSEVRFLDCQPRFPSYVVVRLPLE